jgi:hypothetical protein
VAKSGIVCRDMAGAVAVTAVDMYGREGGLAVSPTNYTFPLAVGGLSEGPGLSARGC